LHNPTKKETAQIFVGQAWLALTCQANIKPMLLALIEVAEDAAAASRVCIDWI